MKKIIALFILTITAFSFTGCGGSGEHFVIVSGSENKALEPLLLEFARDNGIDLQMVYKGSVDIMLDMQKPEFAYDAVWPANSLWIALGDHSRRIKHTRSIMTSPVVFGIRRSLAEKLGFIGRDVRVSDILAASRSGRLTFMMTSATQSNSGASAYLGFLYALAGQPDMLNLDHLRLPALKKDMRDLLSGIHRSSGSSGWLKDLFLSGDYPAMVNYEAVIIETNRELERRGREPLYTIYPVDGISLADSPLGYVNRGDSAKEEIFRRIQSFLLSEQAQKEITAAGRRTGFGGRMVKADQSIFRPQWGIDVKRILTPIPTPPREVIMEALRLYQTEFRKPSLTVFCLDYSGSMNGQGEKQLKQAMSTLLQRETASRYMIQPGGEDRILVLPFNDRVLHRWEAFGGDTGSLETLLGKIRSLRPSSGTDIFSPALEGLQWCQQEAGEQYIPAVILMTDGRSNSGMNFTRMRTTWRRMHSDIPVFGILFGKASRRQLEQLTSLTRGRLFDGSHDLIKAFRKAKGYN